MTGYTAISAAGMLEWILSCSLLVLAAVLFHKSLEDRTKLPPGPKPWPLIGNLPTLIGGKLHVVFKELSDIHGEIFTIWLGSNRVIVLNTLDVMRDALHRQGDDFNARPLQNDFKGLFPDNSGVLAAEGDIWRDNRRFSLSHLRDLGLGKQGVESSIIHEVNTLLLALRGHNDTIDIRPLLGNAVSNVICRLVFGKGYDYESKEFRRLLKMIDYVVSIPLVMRFLPLRFKFCPMVKRYSDKRQRIFNEIKSVILGHFDEHKLSFDKEKTSTSDLMNAYLLGKHGVVDTGKVTDVIFEDDHIAKLTFDFFIAGTETTTTTLQWALLFMITFPDVQDKVRAEILDVVGAERNPSFKDKTDMPYTQAVLTEVQRVGNIVYMSVPHKTSRDITFRGYSIPSDTIIIPNLASIHMNEDVFYAPEVFRPERFLTTNGQFDNSLADQVSPFGIGKRKCLGQSLAKMELFLFFTSLLQQFKFTLPAGDVRPSLDGSGGIVNSPKPFRVTCMPINQSAS